MEVSINNKLVTTLDDLELLKEYIIDKELELKEKENNGYNDELEKVNLVNKTIDDNRELFNEYIKNNNIDLNSDNGKFIFEVFNKIQSKLMYTGMTINDIDQFKINSLESFEDIIKEYNISKITLEPIKEFLSNQPKEESFDKLNNKKIIIEAHKSLILNDLTNYEIFKQQIEIFADKCKETKPSLIININEIENKLIVNNLLIKYPDFEMFLKEKNIISDISDM